MAPEIMPTYGPFDLESATVLITGGSSGIGQGLAEEFLKAGSKVIITGRRESALKETRAKHPKLITFVNDASKVEEREELSRWVVKNHPEVNVLVNNAGIQRKGPLSKEPEDWSIRQSEIAINIEAPVHLMQLLTPHFLKQKEAAIINITSGLAYIPCGFAPVYGGTKAFVHHFTLGSRFHYAKSNVRIVEIAPPAVKTNLGLITHHTMITLRRSIPAACSLLSARIISLKRECLSLPVLQPTCVADLAKLQILLQILENVPSLMLTMYSWFYLRRVEHPRKSSRNKIA